MYLNDWFIKIKDLEFWDFLVIVLYMFGFLGDKGKNRNECLLGF